MGLEMKNVHKAWELATRDLAPEVRAKIKPLSEAIRKLPPDEVVKDFETHVKLLQTAQDTGTPGLNVLTGIKNPPPAVKLAISTLKEILALIQRRLKEVADLRQTVRDALAKILTTATAFWNEPSDARQKTLDAAIKEYGAIMAGGKWQPKGSGLDQFRQTPTQMNLFAKRILDEQAKVNAHKKQVDFVRAEMDKYIKALPTV